MIDKQRFSLFCGVCVQSASRMKRYFGIKANKTLSIYREKAADYDDVFLFFLNLEIRSLSGFEEAAFSLADKNKTRALTRKRKRLTSSSAILLSS